MKWVLINRCHINMNNVDCFHCVAGTLRIYFHGNEEPMEYKDPDGKLYRKLCRSQGIRTYEEEGVIYE